MNQRLRILLLLLFATVALGTRGQNLVPNGSFEEYYQCPDGLENFDHYVKRWFNPTFGSPDYFNACMNVAHPGWGVPNSTLGFQPARTGAAYAGLGGWFTLIPYTDVREYIEVELIAPLQKDSLYCVEFFASNAGLHPGLGISDLGLYVSDDSITRHWPDFDTLNYVPQIAVGDSTQYLVDTLNWTRIGGYYQAHGGERFVTVGNFHSDARTHFSTPPGNVNVIYYYLDDVGVYKNQCGSVLDTFITVPPKLSVSGSGGQLTLSYPLPFGGRSVYTLYDVLGRTMALRESFASVTTLDTRRFSGGLYIVVVSVNGARVATAKWIKTD